MSKKALIVILFLAATAAAYFLIPKFYILYSNPSSVEAAANRTGLTLDLNFGNNNGASAPTVFDSSGYGRNATSTAGSTSPTCGQKFCDFDGSADYMTANATNVFGSSVAIAFKFSPDFAADDGVSHWLFVAHIGNAPHYGCDKYSDNLLYCYFGNTQIAGITFATYGPYWKVGKENVLIISATTGNNSVWLNGQRISNNATAWSETIPTDLFIGCGYYDAPFAFFDGKIHYLKVWNRLLTDAEVQNLSSDRTAYTNSAPRVVSSTPSASGRLVGYWSMDTNDMSANGATMYDKSGFGNNGTVIGTTTSTGKINQARIFNGTSDYIAIPAVTLLSTSSTVAFWFNAHVNTQMIAGKSDSAPSYIRFYSSTIFTIGSEDSTYAQFNVAPGMLLNTWYHVIITQYNSTARLYLNGVEAYVGGQSKTSPTILDEIGRRSNNAYFDGLIDDFRIYNYALTAQDAANLYSSAKVKYASAPPRIGLVGYWSMDTNDMSSTGATVYDKSGNGYNGTPAGFYTGLAPTSTAGKINQAVSFDGSNGHIEIADNNSFDMTDQISIAMWLKPGSTQNANADILSKHGSAGNQSYVIEAGTGTNNYYFTWSDDGTSNFYCTTPYIQLTANTWQHLVISKSGLTATAYINGVYHNSCAGSSAVIYAGNLGLYLGQIAAENFQRHWSGSMDDVRIYNRALSAAEVANLYQSAAINYVR